MKTIFKKAVAVILTVVMLVTVMSTAVFASQISLPSEYIELYLDEEAIGYVKQGGESAWFSFTADASGEYVFESFGDRDTRGYLYDSNGEYLGEDDDSGEDNCFRLNCDLSKGETYYLAAQFFGSGNTGEIPVKVTYADSEDDAVDNETGIVGFDLYPSNLYLDEYDGGEYVDEGEGTFYKYNWLNKLSNITLYLADGSSQTIRLNTSGYRPQFEYNGVHYSLRSYDGQSYDNQWYGGNTYYPVVEISGLDVYCEMSVEIYGDEQPIEEVPQTLSIDDIEIDGLKNGTLATLYDEDNNEINYYQYDEWFENIETVEVTTNLGNVVECPVIQDDYYGPKFIFNGEEYGLWVERYQSYEGRWFPNNTYTTTIDWTYGSVDIKVTVGEEEKLEIDQELEFESEYGEDYFFSFTPEKSAIYKFKVLEDEFYPSFQLYDSSFNSMQFSRYGEDSEVSIINYLEEGKTYYIRTWIYGNGETCPVIITEFDSPVERIIFKPLSLYEYTNGNFEEYYDEKLDQYTSYYEYHWWNNVQYTVITKDGEEIDVYGNYFWIDDECYHFDYQGQYYCKDKWTVGNTYTAKASFFGKEYDVSVSIVESPFEEIIVNPITLYEGVSDGYMSEAWNSETDEYIEYFHYYWDNNLRYTVKTKDGDSFEVSGSGFEYNGDYFNVNVDDDQYENYGWIAGGKASAKLEILGKTYEVPITVEENPISRIEFGPVSVSEKIDGYWNTYWDENDNEHDYFKYSYMNELPYTIYLKDGTTQCGIFGEEGYSVEFGGRNYEIAYEDPQNYFNQWEKGNTYDVEISVLGFTSILKVTIDELKAPEIALNQEVEISGLDYLDSRYFTFTPEADGTYIFECDPCDVDVYGGIYNADMESVSGNYWGFYFETELQAGKKYYFVTYHEYSADYTYNVKVTRAPYITDISIHTIQLYENTGGYYLTDSNGEEYYYYSNWHKGIKKIWVTMSDGNGYNCYLNEEDSEFSFYNEETGKYYYPEISMVQDENNRWVKGESYTVNMTIGEVTTQLTVRIEESPIESVEIDPIEIMDKTGGYYSEGWNDETEGYDLYYKYEWYNEFTCTVKLKNGEVVKGTVWNDYLVCGEDYYSCEIVDDQYKNHWTVGNTYTAYITAAGYTIEVPVSIIPISAQELTLGKKTTVDIDYNGKIEYFTFIPSEDGNYRFESYTDSDTYAVLYDGKMIEIDSNDDGGNESNFRIDYNLEAGETYYYAVRYLSNERTGSFPVMISKAPELIGINFDKVQVYENTNGYMQTASDGSEYYYYSDWYWNLSKVRFSYSNGETVSCEINKGSSEIGFYLQDRWYPLEFYVTQDENNRWELGKKYVAQVAIMGGWGQVEIEIIESPIASIEVQPIQIIENTNGSFIPDWDEDGNFVEYHAYAWGDHVKYVATLKNGQKIEGKGGSFIYNDEEIMIQFYDDQESFATSWKSGNTYTPKLSILGFETVVPVTIIESPVQSVTVKPIAIPAESQGYWEGNWNQYDEYYEFYKYRWFNQDEFVCTVLFKDGTTKEIGYNFEYNNVNYPITITDSQYREHWYPGNTYYETMNVLGYDVTMEISILSKNIENGIEYIVQNDCAIVSGVTQSGTVLEIPETLGGYPVVAISSLCGGDYAEIIIPDSVTALSDNMLGSYCDGLRKITIGSGVEALNNKLFVSAFELEEFIISENNPEYTSVDGIVYDKDVTKMVAIPEAKTTTHIVPETVTDIELYMNGSYKFKIELRNSNTGYVYEDGILYNADKTIVYNCDPDKTGSYVMPDSVEEIGRTAFMNSNLSEVVVSNKVEDIVYYAFAESKSLEKVVLPDTLTSISESAFEGCATLSDINLPSSLTVLEQRAFAKSGILKAVIPAGVKVIEYEAFAYSTLDEVTLSEGIEEIEYGAFEKTKIKSVKIPDSMRKIDGSAFYASALEEIDFGTGVNYIGDWAFAKTNLSSVYIPNCLTVIGENAFSGSKIKNLELQEGIVCEYREHAFSGLDIESIDFPESVTDISYKCFENCENLMNIDLPSELENLDGFAFHGSAWYESQPDGVVYLEDALYHYKGEMEEDAEVVVKHGTRLIADQAFGQYLETSENYSNLKTITLPNTIEYIGDGAFAQCYNITDVYFIGSEYEKEQIQIDGNNDNLLIAQWHYIDCPHEWEDATCEKPKNCILCGITDGNPLQHVHTSYEEYEDATCEDDAVEVSYCDECGEDEIFRTIEGSALGHEWEDATCEEPKTCLECGETEGEPLKHVHTSYEEYEDATCEDDAIEVSYCDECGEDEIFRTVEGSALGHEWEDATCEEPETCLECGETRGKPLSHVFTTYEEYEEATCTDDEIQISYCDECGDAEKTRVVKNSALGHKWKNACDDECDRCGETRKITHKYSNATCTKAKTCSVCKKTSGKALGHNYVTEVTKATSSKNGKSCKKCDRCDKISSESTIYKIKSVELSADEYIYNGKERKPSVKIKDSKGKTISSKYYEATYASGRKKVGEYKVTVKFKGNYSGSKTLYYVINPEKTSVSKITAAKKSLKVTIKKKTTEVTGYQIQYSTSKSFKSAKTKTISKAKTTSLTIKSLSAKKTYYVRVRTYKVVNGKKYYSDWSSAKSKKTK